MNASAFFDDLAFLYPESPAGEVLAELESLLARYRVLPLPASWSGRYVWSERDAVLITYADNVRSPGTAPLATLAEVLPRLVAGCLNTVHLLPFFPWTSDDGFSVADYLEVDPALGSWADVERLAQETRLMFDAVINHMSTWNPWFLGWVAGDERYDGYVITQPPTSDLSLVVRPRTSGLLTTFETVRGTESVWTTFSADQVDLNYANPVVLLDIIRVLLEYVRRGADVIRLDAVTYLWKEVGTSSVHHPKTHRVIQLLRKVLDEVAPQVTLITETNVPHAENVSYFGDGHNEAQLVYNFALPPLVLHSFVAADATKLSTWAADLSTPSPQTCFFNFLASHDGIGLRGTEAILTADETQALTLQTERHGGFVGYRSAADGSSVPYELNVNYFDALSDPAADEPIEVQIARFLTAQAIMLTLPGVPGVYLHSLLGSRGWPDGVADSGHNRATNREKLDAATLLAELDEPQSRRALVLDGYRALLQARRLHSAFHPNSPASVLVSDPRLFAIRRGSGSDLVTCVHNVSGDEVRYAVPGAAVIAGGGPGSAPGAYDGVIPPWSTRWLST